MHIVSITFFAVLIVSASAYSMNRENNYHIIPELFACSIINLEHNLVCTMAQVNKKLNNIMHSTAQQRKTYLEAHVQQYPTIMPSFDQRTAWHILGSACAFICVTKAAASEKNDDDNRWPGHPILPVNLCRLQTAGNGHVTNYVHTIMECNIGPRHNRLMKYAYSLHGPNGSDSEDWSGRWFETIMLVPIFDASGKAKACVYYSVHDRPDELFTEISIDSQGIVEKMTCMFEFRQKEYPLWILAGKEVMRAFINSTHTQQKGTTKIFMSDGVTKNGIPLKCRSIRKICRAIKAYNEL
jgi:hypothetical protein